MTQQRERAEEQMEPIAPGATSAAAPENGGQGPAFSLLLAQVSAEEKTQWLRLIGAVGAAFWPWPRPHQTDPADVSLLRRLLSGQLTGLDVPAPPSDFTPFDAGLDELQRGAAARALASPDLFLIQGAPGTGKSRLLAEIIRQETARGRRVLFVSPLSQAVDGVLERIAGHESLLGLRCLGPGEDPAGLTELIRPLVFANVAASITGRAAAAARGQLERAENECRDVSREISALESLTALAQGAEDLAAQARELVMRRGGLAEAVRAETLSGGDSTAGSAFQANVEGERSRHQTATANLQAQLEETEQAERHRSTELHTWEEKVQAQLRVVEARPFVPWRWVCWRALFQGGRAGKRLAEYQCRADEARKTMELAQIRRAEVQGQQRTEVDYHAKAVEHLIELEAARRAADLDEKQAALVRRQDELQNEWRTVRAGLRTVKHLPTTPSMVEVTSAIEATRARDETLQRQARFARQWLAERTTDDKPAPPHWPRSVNLIAGPAAAVAADPLLNDACAGRFDLLIVDQADRLTQEELLSLAARGDRWIMSGYPPPAQTKPGAFQRLWNALHGGPGRQHCDWVQADDALVCRLSPVPAEQRDWLECERLADQPDVELRILAPPRASPVLAEVVFPSAAFAIDRAKAFLFRQLQELTLCPEADDWHWLQKPHLLVLHFGDQHGATRGEFAVDLDEGVREIIHPCGSAVNGSLNDEQRWSTCRLEFDLGRGWDRVRAEQWLRDRAKFQDQGRTCALTRRWRGGQLLTSLVTWLLREEPTGALAPPPDWDKVLQFAPVSAPAAAAPLPRSRQTPPRAGPGLELDLANPNHRQKIPAEIRSLLPAQGIVNYAEADVVVQQLERWLPRLISKNVETPAVLPIAVLSWQPAQVQLLRLLWERRARKSTMTGVLFHTVSAFREQEAALVTLSLCRSHGQRTHPYAADAQEWSIALGAARQHLLIVGDPAALQRRSQLEGSPEGQSEALAAWERTIAGRLLRLLPTSLRSNQPQVARAH